METGKDLIDNRLEPLSDILNSQDLVLENAIKKLLKAVWTYKTQLPEEQNGHFLESFDGINIHQVWNLLHGSTLSISAGVITHKHKEKTLREIKEIKKAHKGQPRSIEYLCNPTLECTDDGLFIALCNYNHTGFNESDIQVNINHAREHILELSQFSKTLAEKMKEITNRNNDMSDAIIDILNNT